MASNQWSFENIPPQNGKLAVITGGNSGIGFEAARMLAAKGARVIIAVRNPTKGQQAVAALGRAVPGAAVAAMELDLADLASVRGFAEAFLARHSELPLLINNAGVMAIPYRRTVDGFEMQLGTNHFGHFALTGLLLPALLAAPGARIVTVSSGAHLGGKINFDDLDSKHNYQRWAAYSQSKLANLLFAYELQRRLEAAGADAISVACHPGFASTELQVAGARMDGSAFGERAAVVMNRIFAQSAEMGALPTVYAATAPDLRGGNYIGPDGPLEMRGHPTMVRSNKRSHDAALARQLWQISEQRTGVRYEALEQAVHMT